MCATLRTVGPTLACRLVAGFLAAAIVAARAQAREPATIERTEGKVVELTPLEVTGSRLKRAQAEKLTPILRVERSTIERAGYLRPEDYLRQLPLGVSGAQDTTSPTTFQPGITSLNLRGLGYSSGLPLVNGRRVAPFGQAGAAQLGYDFGSIPFAALERIEIAKDGASAVYGSDAVAGVVNYRLRTDFVGTEWRGGYRALEGTDAGAWNAGLLHGWRAGRAHVVLALEHDDGHSVLFADRAISRSEDFRAIGGYDLRAPYTFPAHLVVPAGTPGVPVELTGRLIAPGVGLANGLVQLRATRAPTIAGFVVLPPVTTNGVYTAGDTRNGLDRAAYSTMLPRLHNTGAWLYATYELQPNLTVFWDASFRHRIVGTTYEPSTISLVGEVGFGDLPGGRMVFPAKNPYNPFGVDIVDLTFYLPQMEARDNEMTVETPRVVAGAKGELGGDWDWEAAVTFAQSRVASRWTKFLSDQALQDGLSGRLGGWLNPFGPSDPGVIERLRTDLRDLQLARFWMGDAQARGPLWALPTGTVQGVFGGEWRNDRFIHRPDTLRGNGGLVSLARRPPRNLHRSVAATYSELAVPLGARMEFTVAGRWEHYRDFGDPVKPKAAFRWEVARGVTLRATYSEAFRAPEMLQAYTDVQETFVQTADPLRPDLGIYTMRVLNGGNPALRPEETAVTYLGAAWEPAFARGLRLAADAWGYRQRNLIGTLGAATMLRNEATVAPGRIVRGPAPSPGVAGEVIQLNDTFGNFNRYTTTGWDLEVDYRWRVGAHRFGVNAMAVMLGSARRQVLGFNETESVDSISFARWRANARLDWGRGPWDATLHFNWIGAQDGPMLAQGLPGSADDLLQTNLSVGWSWPRGGRVRVGVNNAFDLDPPRNYQSRTGYANGYYDSLGRTWFVTWERAY